MAQPSPTLVTCDVLTCSIHGTQQGHMILWPVAETCASDRFVNRMIHFATWCSNDERMFLRCMVLFPSITSRSCSSIIYFYNNWSLKVENGLVLLPLYFTQINKHDMKCHVGKQKSTDTYRREIKVLTKLENEANAELPDKVNQITIKSNHDPYIEIKRNTIAQKHKINGSAGMMPTMYHRASCILWPVKGVMLPNHIRSNEDDAAGKRQCFSVARPGCCSSLVNWS